MQFNLLGQLRWLIVQCNEAADAFHIFKQGTLLVPAADLRNGEVSSEHAADVAAEDVDTFKAQAEGILASATGDELITAYQQVEGEVGDLAPKREMRGRNLGE